MSPTANAPRHKGPPDEAPRPAGRRIRRAAALRWHPRIVVIFPALPGAVGEAPVAGWLPGREGRSGKDAPRIAAAVFGIFWHEYLAETARQITIPVEFVLQWDDEHIPRQSGLALFDAFASKEKTLLANAGRHKELPRFEADSAVRFFAGHLGRAVTSPA
ncbi:MAG: hypothetical protein QOI83_2398 [Streptomycetaceae bacterium]|nr:hypothetical protein [Streptomycetaceae bacterium]